MCDMKCDRKCFTRPVVVFGLVLVLLFVLALFCVRCAKNAFQHVLLVATYVLCVAGCSSHVLFDKGLL